MGFIGGKRGVEDGVGIEIKVNTSPGEGGDWSVTFHENLKK